MGRAALIGIKDVDFIDGQKSPRRSRITEGRESELFSCSAYSHGARAT
jgi:hypothetical protein